MAAQALQARSLCFTSGRSQAVSGIDPASNACRTRGFAAAPLSKPRLKHCISPSHSGTHQMRAQTNFGGEGFSPNTDEEYNAIKGIEELARQINESVLSKLQEKNIKLYLISIGPPERGRKFNDLTGLPEELILADPDNLAYDALEFKNDTFSAFFSPETPKALWQRIREGKTEDLVKTLKRWPTEGFFRPPKDSQAKQQGGTLVFDGQKTIWRYNDPATSAHAKPDQILRESLKGLD